MANEKNGQKFAEKQKELLREQEGLPEDIQYELLPKELQSPVARRNKRAYWVFKRILDFLFSLMAVIILIPLWIIVPLVILIDDPHGSPFYAQVRCSRHKRSFKVYKFRTMIKNAESLKAELEQQNEMDGPVFKIKNDPRITRVGRFLRKTSLDELPQLFNVLKGDLCLIGPRPPLPEEVVRYNEYQEQRLYITPGLTCYWQVAHKRNSISFDEWVELDLKYMRDRSLWVDFVILCKTVVVMLRGEGQ